jgi:hypothetical protein
MLGDVSGTRNGQEWPKRGDVAEFSDDEAAQLIGSGIAVKHDDIPEVEAAVVDTRPARRGKPITTGSLAGDQP